VVLRTYGTDLPALIAAIDAFAAGLHPLYPGLESPEFRVPPERVWEGRYAAADGTFSMRRAACAPEGAPEGAPVAPDGAPIASAPFTSEEAMLRELEGTDGALVRLSAMQDDYPWWKAAAYSPAAGKPLWLSLSALHERRGFRHVFFDDNIHANPHDSIVAVRARGGDHEPFAPVSGGATMALHGSVLKKVPTAQVVEQPGWFLEQIARCDEQVDNLVARDLRGDGGGFADLLAL
jgi:hypothetical protein